jgi:hydrogenase-1 operon protein HyaF
MSDDANDDREHALMFPGPVVGPGSQPEEDDGAELDYMVMPEGMSVYSVPDLPEPDELAGRTATMDVLNRVAEGLAAFKVGDKPIAYDVSDLDTANRELLDQILGEGEVSMIAGGLAQAQESVLAGVWRVRLTNPDGALVSDSIEIGPFPNTVLQLAFRGARDRLATDAEVLDGVANAPALVTEINAELAEREQIAKDEPHVINLSLLPLSEQDVTYLGSLLGYGPVTVLSRGYGNCRIQSTATRGVWAVQFFNSQDTLILNTIEVTDVPLMACAAQEDIDDSAQRLVEILKVYQ